MKHRIGFNALSRNNAERKALKRNMVTSLFRYERIETTKAKAKEVQRLAEKMITRAKVDNVHNRRLTSAILFDEAVVNKLFTEIAPLYADVNGGYTRIIKTGYRANDNAPMCFIELVDFDENMAKTPKKAKRTRRSSKKAAEAPAAETPTATEAPAEEAPAEAAE